MPTVEELQGLIDAERSRHASEMEKLHQNVKALQSVLTEQQQTFRELVTRVVDLRVEKGERAVDRGKKESSTFSTGCGSLDGILSYLQGKLHDTGSTADKRDSLLRQLETAALEAMTPYGHGKMSSLFTSNSSAVQTTGVLLEFLNDIRGVRDWATDHVGNCRSCASRCKRMPSWSPYRPASAIGTGLSSALNLRAIPSKKFSRFSFSLRQERSLADRCDTDQTIDLLTATAVVLVQQRSSGQLLDDLPSVAQRISTTFTTRLQQAMEQVQREISTSAPWCQADSPTRNDRLAVAVEVLLHMLKPRIAVSPLADATVDSTEGKRCSVVQVDAAISAPVQVSAMAPFLEMMKEPAEREYMYQHIFTPLAQRLGGVMGLSDEAASYSPALLRFCEGLYRLVEHGDLTAAASADLKGSSGRTGPSLRQLYSVLQALAVFGTTVEVELAIPSTATVAPTMKQRVLSVATSLLRNLTTPSPYCFPPTDDPAIANVAVQLRRAPTSFLRLLNRTFSSPHRLPPTSRMSLLDAVMSPRLKISAGLQLYRELVVAVCRPYQPNCGVMLAGERGSSSGAGAAAPSFCQPVVQLPPDVVASNVAVGGAAARLLERVEAEAARPPTAETVSEVERQGRQLWTKLGETVRGCSLVEQLSKDWAEMDLQVVEVARTRMDVVLPFSFLEDDLLQATRPLLYLRCLWER